MLIFKPMTLQAYFDDSGERDQAVGGCIASVDAWSAFRTEWQDVLAQFDIEWFHANAFEHGNSGFTPANKSDRTSFLNRLLEVLVRNISPITGGAFVYAIAGPELVQHLNARGKLGKEPPKRGKTPPEKWVDRMVKTLSDPYSVCLGHALRGTLELTIGGQDTIQIFIAHQPNHTESIEYIRKMLGGAPRFSGRLAGLEYGKKMQPKDILPLQAADFAAYYLSRKNRSPSNSRAWVADKLQPQFPFIVPDPGWLTERWGTY